MVSLDLTKRTFIAWGLMIVHFNFASLMSAYSLVAKQVFGKVVVSEIKKRGVTIPLFNFESTSYF